MEDNGEEAGNTERHIMRTMMDGTRKWVWYVPLKAQKRRQHQHQQQWNRRQRQKGGERQLSQNMGMEEDNGKGATHKTVERTQRTQIEAGGSGRDGNDNTMVTIQGQGDSTTHDGKILGKQQEGGKRDNKHPGGGATEIKQRHYHRIQKGKERLRLRTRQRRIIKTTQREWTRIIWGWVRTAKAARDNNTRMTKKEEGTQGSRTDGQIGEERLLAGMMENLGLDPG